MGNCQRRQLPLAWNSAFTWRQKRRRLRRSTSPTTTPYAADPETRSAHAHEPRRPSGHQGHHAPAARRGQFLELPAQGGGRRRQTHHCRPALPHRRGSPPPCPTATQSPCACSRRSTSTSPSPQGLKVTEDSPRHHPVLPRRRLGERRPWTSTWTPAPPWRCDSSDAWWPWTTGALPSTGFPRRRRTATRWPASCTPARCFDDVDADHIVLFGDSAGGNLAAVVSLMARDRGEFCAAHADAPVPADVQRPRSCDLAVRFGARQRRGLPAHLAQTSSATWSCTVERPTDFPNPYFAPLC